MLYWPVWTPFLDWVVSSNKTLLKNKTQRWELAVTVLEHCWIQYDLYSERDGAFILKGRHRASPRSPVAHWSIVHPRASVVVLGRWYYFFFFTNHWGRRYYNCSHNNRFLFGYYYIFIYLILRYLFYYRCYGKYMIFKNLGLNT